MSHFKKFSDRKREEILNRQQSFDEAKLFGTTPYSTRQPAAFHYYLTLLDRFIPESSKAEILFEAIRSAYQDVVVPAQEAMTEPVREVTDNVYNMLFNAYQAKCSREGIPFVHLTNDYSEQVDEEIRSLAERYLSDFESGRMDYNALADKYLGTLLDPDYEVDEKEEQAE